jgi:hypothetical protein
MLWRHFLKLKRRTNKKFEKKKEKTFSQQQVEKERKYLLAF